MTPVELYLFSPALGTVLVLSLTPLTPLTVPFCQQNSCSLRRCPHVSFPLYLVTWYYLSTKMVKESKHMSQRFLKVREENLCKTLRTGLTVSRWGLHDLGVGTFCCCCCCYFCYIIGCLGTWSLCYLISIIAIFFC